MSETNENLPWITKREAYKEALQYLKGRKEGLIKSVRTPWKRFNDATVDGFEWHSMIVIAGRPGTGKTMIKDQIIREAFNLNTHTYFKVLEFQFEMVARASAIREYSSVIKKSYKYICSADNNVLTDAELDACRAYSKQKVNDPVDIIQTPCTINEFEELVESWFEFNSTVVSGEKTYTPGIVTVDHSVLFKRASFEKDRMDTLYNLGECLTRVKRKFPVIFIILSQLNRNVDSVERSGDGKHGNYILDSDIFGSDALLQHADTVVAFNRPASKNIRLYGPEKYIIGDENILVGHFLKVRNGDTRMSFFKAEFEKMSIIEIPPPPMQQSKSKI